MSVGIPHNSAEIGPVPDSTPDPVSDPAPGRSCYANALAQATLHNLRIFIILWAITCPTSAYADSSPALTSDTSAPYLFWLLMILLGAAAYIYLTHREKKLADHDPDPWAEPEFLDSILLLAREQGAQLRLQILPAALDGLPESTPLSQSTHGPSVSSVCVHFDSTRLIIVPEKISPRPPSLPHAGHHDAVSPPPLAGALADSLDNVYIPLPALDFAPPPLLFQAGQSVRVDFCVKTGGENRTFQFETLVLRHDRPSQNDVDPALSDAPLIELARPTRVARFQRRTFERIRPHRTDIAALGVWDWTPGPTLPCHPGSDSAHTPSFDDAAPFSTPPLAMLPGCRENVRLDNISATGIALRVRAATLAESRSHGEKWRGCIIFLSLRESGNHTHMLWLACVRRHATVSASRPSSAVLGWEIAGWAETPDAQSPIAWKPTASCGETPPLLRWIVRRLPMARRYRRINL